MIAKITFSIALYFIMLAAVANSEFVRLINTGEPISLELTQDQEVQVTFESKLQRIGIPEDISNKIKIQSIDYRLWITALGDFSPIKLLVEDEKGHIIILLLSADSQTTTEHTKYHITLKKNQIKSKKAPSSNSSLNYIDLTRYAAQVLYAPQRLIEDINVNRVPINIGIDIDLFVCSANLACNGNVKANALAAWRSDKYYVSAILLKNQTSRQILLDPRDLIGNWKAATFQFNKLGANGSIKDTSVVYLISTQPFI